MNSAVFAFIRLHWKPIVIVVAFLVSNIGSYSLGRYGTAEQVVIQEKVHLVDVVHEVLVQVEKVVEKKVYIKDERQKIHREETATTHPDGTTVTQKTEDINIDSHVRDVEVREVEKQVVVEKVVEKIVEKEVFVEKDKPMPDWRIGIMAGPNLPEVPGLISGDPFDPLKHLAYGAEVQRRVWGPVSATAWGTSTGLAGLGINLEF